MKNPKNLLIANFEVTEIWKVECPHCFHDQDAEFNHGNPMEPMEVHCEDCYKPFILTYDRND